MGVSNEEPSVNTTNSGSFSNNQQNELAPLYSNGQDQRKLQIIIFLFSIITFAVSVVLFQQLQYGDYEVIPHGSVASDNERCSMIGADLIKNGGNAVDAAVATTFCISVVNPHLTGIGGGGLMLIYDHRLGKVIDSIDFRAQKGIHKSIGVPGFLAGLALAHSLYGSVKWSKLLEPSIYLAKEGFPVSRSLMDSKTHVLPNVLHNLALKSWLSSIVEDELITNHDLAQTLQVISDMGVTEFYNGSLSVELTAWLPSKYISSYEAKRNLGMISVFKGYDVIVSGNGSGGPYLLNSFPHLMANTLSMVASLSMAFSENSIDKWPVVSGSHVSTMDTNDLYVSVVTGLGSILGSQFLTSGGYILNNALENIQGPAAPELLDGQFIPTLSSPIIITQSAVVCGRRFVLGCGDVRDGMQTILNLLKNTNETSILEDQLLSLPVQQQSIAEHDISLEEKLITDTIESPRVRIIGPHIAQEHWHPQQLTAKEIFNLKSLNLNLDIAAPLPYPSLNIIEKMANNIYAYSDSRGYGKSVVF